MNFTTLYVEISDLRRVRSSGRVVNSCEGGICIVTDFPLEPGHVLEWDDSHQKGKLHIAMVKWCEKKDDGYKAGLMFI